MDKVRIDDVVDYIVVKLDEAGASLTILKLQKLLYYVQAWRLALKDQTLFDGKFQAWVHGPVNRHIYDRFAGKYTMYAALHREDVRPDFDANAMSPSVRAHIDEVLEAYANYTGSQLERMTHDEEPWIAARGDRAPAERCERELDEALMASYFKQELAEASRA